MDGGEPRHPTLIVDINGATQPRRVRVNADVDTFRPKDWSPDGRTLVGLAFRPDGSQQIAMVGIDDGSYRGLKTVGWRGPRTVLLSPDGRYLAYDLPASDDEDQRDVFVLAVDASGETRLVHPAHDVFLGWSPDGGHLLFASDRHTTVGVWAVRMTDGKPQGEATLVKPNVGAVSSLGVTSSGALHLVKDASTLTLQVAPIDLGTGRLAGPPVAENFGVQYPTWSPDGNTLTYAHTGANGIRVLAIRSMDTGAIRHVRPALHYFRHTPMAPDGQSVVTFGRDRNGKPGIYRIDLRDGRTTLLVPEARIAPVDLSPDGRKLYHEVGNNMPEQPVRLVERDLASGDTREVFRPAEGSTGISRLSADGQHLATIDVDSASRASHVVIRPVAGGAARTLLTVNHPDSLAAFGGLNWAPGGRAVTVVKRLGGTPARQELWLVPVDGSQARRLDIDIDGWHIGPDSVRLSPDGRRITFLTGRAAQEVWRIESVMPALNAAATR